MVAIKFQKTGKKHQAYLRIVVAEKRSKLDGKTIDDLGWVNPHEKTANIKKEEVLRWIKNGAQPTASVRNFFIKKGILRGKKIAVHSKAKAPEKVE